MLKKIFKISKIIIIDFVISVVVFLIAIIQFSKFVKKEIILKIMVYRGTAHMQPGEELGVETVTILLGIIFPFIFFIVSLFSGIKHYLRYKKLKAAPKYSMHGEKN